MQKAIGHHLRFQDRMLSNGNFRKVSLGAASGSNTRNMLRVRRTGPTTASAEGIHLFIPQISIEHSVTVAEGVGLWKGHI